KVVSMSLETPSVYITNSPEETAKIASEFAKSIKPGDCLALYGEMGAGKTVFVSGLAKGLGIAADVTSPTFSLMNVYGPVYHFDLFRLTEQEAEDEGLDEYACDKTKISVIEWPKDSLLPPGAIKVKFEIIGENTRQISIYRCKE
ncbi:MAG TPA: tRNA (adenosine(37)-N6)-threonylcarbamoyltransferase complex ATPase subunit type 1 TsaE, partial [Clostridia bacterium]|nr:tRNA (adenosine(37)-N6)-threonylcarbamoyltransferase complex ATPase subunit type 1 TsaE [Clostridia bacterium]